MHRTDEADADMVTSGDAGATDAGATDAGATDADATDAGATDAADAGASESYLDILDEAVGFARPAGGAAGPRIFVTSLSDSGPGTLREAVGRGGPLWISFEDGLMGTIDLESSLSVPSDTTIDGRGADITLTGNALIMGGTDTRNIIVTHLKIYDTPDDAIRIMSGAGPIWVNHCSLGGYGDGAIDITGGRESHPTDVTVSWCHIDGGDKASLVSSTSDPDAGHRDENLYVTYHHNYFDGNRERSPRTRFAKVHHFNNYLREAGYIGASTLAEILVEHDIFETSTGSRATYVGCIGADCDYNADWGLEPGEGGAVTGSGNWLDAGSSTARYATANETLVFQEFAGRTPPYVYTLESADDALRSTIRREAGWQPVSVPD
jgi:pectate lyase